MGSGTNDVVIFTSIMFFLVGLGVLAPMSQGGLNVRIDQSSTLTVFENINQSSITNAPDIFGGTGSIWAMLANIFIALFWTFSWFPWWLQLFHIGLRVILIYLLIRLFRSGAG
jgi:membrane protein insertase Oxa1/YidC/SpoIIIJ